MVGARLASVLIVGLALGGLAACNDSADSSCQELKAWYQENPGDSNPSIARRFEEACGEQAPPIRSGELDEDYEYEN